MSLPRIRAEFDSRVAQDFAARASCRAAHNARRLGPSMQSQVVLTAQWEGSVGEGNARHEAHGCKCATVVQQRARLGASPCCTTQNARRPAKCTTQVNPSRRIATLTSSPHMCLFVVRRTATRVHGPPRTRTTLQHRPQEPQQRARPGEVQAWQHTHTCGRRVAPPGAQPAGHSQQERPSQQLAS